MHHRVCMILAGLGVWHYGCDVWCQCHGVGVCGLAPLKERVGTKCRILLISLRNRFNQSEELARPLRDLTFAISDADPLGMAYAISFWNSSNFANDLEFCKFRKGRKFVEFVRFRKGLEFVGFVKREGILGIIEFRKKRLPLALGKTAKDAAPGRSTVG